MNTIYEYNDIYVTVKTDVDSNQIEQENKYLHCLLDKANEDIKYLLLNHYKCIKCKHFIDPSWCNVNWNCSNMAEWKEYNKEKQHLNLIGLCEGGAIFYG